MIHLLSRFPKIPVSRGQVGVINHLVQTSFQKFPGVAERVRTPEVMYLLTIKNYGGFDYVMELCRTIKSS